MNQIFTQFVPISFNALGNSVHICVALLPSMELVFLLVLLLVICFFCRCCQFVCHFVSVRSVCTTFAHLEMVVRLCVYDVCVSIKMDIPFNCVFIYFDLFPVWSSSNNNVLLFAGVLCIGYIWKRERGREREIRTYSKFCSYLNVLFRLFRLQCVA